MSPPSPSCSTAPPLEARVLSEQLQRALDGRVVIEQDKGVVAERAGVEMEQAFATLRFYARNQNRRLVDVAKEVVDGTLAPTSLNRPKA